MLFLCFLSSFLELSFLSLLCLFLWLSFYSWPWNAHYRQVLKGQLAGVSASLVEGQKNTELNRMLKFLRCYLRICLQQEALQKARLMPLLLVTGL